ncbi:MAG TPA: CBS domain-containing protein [Chitinophagaceae bacterium]|nr:CBS domain-containing protein [Chitinophagaceae bacterium]
MLAKQIIQTNFPIIQLNDKVIVALRILDDFDIQHLPIISEDKFVGIISKDDLLDADENNIIATLQNYFNTAFVKTEEYFLSAIKLAAQYQLSAIAVVNEQIELQGIIPLNELVNATALYLSCNEPGGMIILETEKRHFSFGEISRLIETNDSYITQLNTYEEQDTGLFIVTIKVNTIEISDIVATLQRYDYTIRYYFGEEQYNNELKENLNQLMFYINM